MRIGNIKYFNLYLLILFSFIVRIAAVYHYGDAEIEHEWKELLINLYNNALTRINNMTNRDYRIEISLSDEKNYAIANVIIFEI